MTILGSDNSMGLMKNKYSCFVLVLAPSNRKKQLLSNILSGCGIGKRKRVRSGLLLAFGFSTACLLLYHHQALSES